LSAWCSLTQSYASGQFGRHDETFCSARRHAFNVLKTPQSDLGQVREIADVIEHPTRHL
jgi:hypothetical protein